MQKNKLFSITSLCQKCPLYALNQQHQKPKTNTKIASGTLYKYLKRKGEIEYPKIQGKRDPEEVSHWYWAYSYGASENHQWVVRKLSVPRYKVAAVRLAIENQWPVESIIQFIKFVD